MFLLKDNLVTSTPTIDITTTEDPEKLQRHRELLEETGAVGVMFGSKAFVQLIANPVVGFLTHKYVSNMKLNFISINIDILIKLNFIFIQDWLQYSNVYWIHYHVPFLSHFCIRSYL